MPDTRFLGGYGQVPGGTDYYSGILEYLKRLSAIPAPLNPLPYAAPLASLGMGLRERVGGTGPAGPLRQSPPGSPTSPVVPSPAPSTPISPGMTKDDLEASRQRGIADSLRGAAPPPAPFNPNWRMPPVYPGAPTGEVPEIPSPGPSFDPRWTPEAIAGGLEEATGFPGQPTGAPPWRDPTMPEPSHIRYALPLGDRSGMGPMRDYEMGPGAADPGFVGGAMGVQTRPGGGAFTPGAPWSDVPEETRRLFPSYWEDMQGKLTEDRMQRALADPLWEEREKARIWREAQEETTSNILNTVLRSIDEKMDRELQATRDSDAYRAATPQERQMKEDMIRAAAAEEKANFVSRFRTPSMTMPQEVFR